MVLSHQMPAIPANAVTPLPTILTWPSSARPGSTLLLRLTLTDTATGVPLAPSNDYWLSNLSTNTSVPQDFAALDTLRTKGPFVAVEVAATALVLSDGSTLAVNATLSSPMDAPAMAFACRVSLRCGNVRIAHVSSPRHSPQTAWGVNKHFGTLLRAHDRAWPSVQEWGRKGWPRSPRSCERL